LSKIVPSSTTKKSDDWKKVFEKMREAIDIKVSDTCEPVQLNTIGGFSLGALDRFRIGYRKRKSESGNEVEVKGPSALMELCEQDPNIKKQYDDFIKS